VNRKRRKKKQGKTKNRPGDPELSQREQKEAQKREQAKKKDVKDKQLKQEELSGPPKLKDRDAGQRLKSEVLNVEPSKSKAATGYFESLVVATKKDNDNDG